MVLIAFEGIDRAGKDTQVELLAHSLRERGYRVRTMKFPNRDNATGRLIHEVLQKRVELSRECLRLLFIANMWEDIALLHPDADDVVLCNRYLHSGIAYAVAQGISEQWTVDQQAGLPSPDVVVYLDLSVAGADSRSGFGDELFERKDFLGRVSEAYDDCLPSDVLRVDASQERDAVLATVLEKLEPLLKHL
jgi:dTMP kinase